MDNEENKQAENTDVEQTVPESPSESRSDREEAPAPSEPESAPASEERGEDAERHETRAERRINQLVSKLKDRGSEEQQVAQQSQGPQYGQDPFANAPWNQRNQSIWGQEQVTPEQIEEYTNRKAAAIAELKANEAINRFTYTQSVEKFSNDLDTVAKAPEFQDQAFDESYSKLYQKLNFDERGQFVPRVSPSEIYNDLRRARESAISEGQRQTTVKLATQAAHGAVPPTGSSQSNEPNLADLEKELWRNPEKVAAYLEKRLPHTEE